jgi:hypothetical protein
VGGTRGTRGRGISVNRVLVRRPEDLGVCGRITLNWTLGRQGSMGRIGLYWLGIGSSGGLL